MRRDEALANSADYDDAGGVNTLLSVWGFVDAGIFPTKAGHVGLVYRLGGVDIDGLTHVQRRALTHRMGDCPDGRQLGTIRAPLAAAGF